MGGVGVPCGLVLGAGAHLGGDGAHLLDERRDAVLVLHHDDGALLVDERADEGDVLALPRVVHLLGLLDGLLGGGGGGRRLGHGCAGGLPQQEVCTASGSGSAFWLRVRRAHAWATESAGRGRIAGGQAGGFVLGRPGWQPEKTGRRSEPRARGRGGARRGVRMASAVQVAGRRERLNTFW